VESDDSAENPLRSLARYRWQQGVENKNIMQQTIGTYEGYEIFYSSKNEYSLIKFALIIYSNYNVKFKYPNNAIYFGSYSEIKQDHFLIRVENSDNQRNFIFQFPTNENSIILGVAMRFNENTVYSNSIIIERSNNLSFSLIEPIEVSIKKIEEIEEYTQINSLINGALLRGFFSSKGDIGEIKDFFTSNRNQETIRELRKEFENFKRDQEKINQKILPKESLEFKAKMKEMLSNNQLKEVIFKLKKHFEDKSELRYDEMILLNSKFGRIESEFRINVISREQYEIFLSQINYELIKIINLIDE
jgi:hypothetical protein